MKFIKGFKIRMLPTKEQEKFLFDITNACRHTWNWCIARQRKEYEEKEMILNGRDLFQEFKHYKYTKPWIMQLPLIYINQVLQDIQKAYKRFYKEDKNGNKCGLPDYKKKRKVKPSFNDNGNNTYFKINKKTGYLYVNIAKLGLVRVNPNYKELESLFKLSREEQLKLIGNPRFTYEHGIWTVNFVLECENQAPELTDNLMGIDLGLKELAIVKYGDQYLHFKNINKTSKVKRLDQQLKRVKRKRSRAYEKNGKKNPKCKYKQTNNINRLLKRERKLSRKLVNIRYNYIHQTTHTLIEMLPKRICLEDLKISNMVKCHKIAKSVYDMLWYEFRRQMEYKAQRYGIEIVFADRWYPSSKTCSQCGNIKRDLGRGERIYKCDVCGLIIDRDENAASNLQKYKL